MNFRTALSVFCFLLFIQGYAQVPAFGQSRYCDLASWNLFWYGDQQNGPSNKQVQASAVGEVIRNSKIDIWFFQEVVDTQSLTGILAANGSYGHVYSRYWQSQKTGWVWNTSEWEYISDSMILDPYAADFASGRLPLYCGLRSKKTGDTLHLLGIHLKAHTGDDAAKFKAWQSRGKAVLHLQNWVRNYSNKNVLIAGDWNDDIDKSIYQDSTSPLLPLKEDGNFLLEYLSWAGGHSWYYGQDMIDHIWVNQKMEEIYVAKSAKLLPLDLYFQNYPATVSDHFPVFSSFQFLPNGVENQKETRLMVYPNPSSGSINLSADFKISRVEIIDLQGNILSHSEWDSFELTIKTELVAGNYILRIYGGEVPLYRRLVLRP